MADEELTRIIELVRRVRHDANNPLTAALGHVQLLLEDRELLPADAVESLEIVESELRRLAGILRELSQVRVPS